MTEQDPKAATDDADEGPPAVRRIDPSSWKSWSAR